MSTILIAVKSELLLVGAGGHCRSCIEAIESQGNYRIRGIVGTSNEVGMDVFGYPVLGCDHDLPDLIRDCCNAIVAVGQNVDTDLRCNLYGELTSLGASLPSIVASSAIASRHARIGAGTIVMHGAIVNAAAVIGVNSIVNTHALVEHDVHIGDHCHVATASVVNGGATIGERTFLGSNATVFPGVRIGHGVVIGAGVLVTNDVKNGEVIRSGRH